MALDYLQTCNQVEKENIENDLLALYKSALSDERKCFADTMRNKRSHKARNNYYESVQRLGAITDVLDILHIDYDNENFEEV